MGDRRWRIIGSPIAYCLLPIASVHDPLEIWDIFEKQLILEVDRIRRDHHALAASGRELRGWDKVAEPLARASAGLDHDRLAVVDRPRDRLGHDHLLLALLVALERAAQRAIGRKEAPHRLDVERPRVAGGLERDSGL